AREGAGVAIHGRDETALAVVHADIERAGGRAIRVVADVTRFEEIEALRAHVESQLGPVDILVANAGGNPSPPAPVETISEATWRATVDANLTATFLTVKSFLPGMKARNAGTIITISSAAARRPHPGSPIAYAAAKAAIQIFTQDVAAQAGPHNIRINCIAPEIILTERNQAAIPPAQQSQLAELHPLRRLGSPDDVARAALFLSSPESAWITGVVLDVSGGAVMTT
ncbi:MAG TPA: SDR family NAD(P)-dependent oxidoreductase, partial [Vicinamibacterales bacterium]|nr:SDR family NAD(P)-dependent oxidoreductase [Vicinamibacterales bacterium]